MTPHVDVLLEAARLAEQGTPFALATVVRVERPASARRGDRGLVTADGELHGWVGGACSEPIVVREALRALAAGEPRLVRIGPPGRDEEPPADVLPAVSACASEGVVEVLVEPQLPAPSLAVVGESPAAHTLAELARTIGWRVTADADGADAVVVAAMGRGDEDAVERALRSAAGYVALVASSRRASGVVTALRGRGVGEEALARLRSPAGLDLGPSTQEEIAVAVLAELVAWRHQRPVPAHVAETVDPVCGTALAAEGVRETFVHEGVTYAFCCPGCRGRFERGPERYVAGRV